MKNVDLRTREGQEADVLREVRENGGFSVFWATETEKRAHAIERLQARGVIVRAPLVVGRPPEQFPFARYRIVVVSEVRW